MKRALGAATCLFIALASLRKVMDPDLFWHLRTGRWMAEHHAIPRSDPFSYASGGRWEFSDTLASLWFHWGEAVGGIAGVQLFTAVLVLVLAAVVLVPTRAGSLRAGGSARAVDAGSAVTLALFGAAASFRLGPKADLFSFIGFAAVLWIVWRCEERGDPRALGLLLPLFALWGNCHRGGTFGWFALMLASLGWAARRETRALGARAGVVALLSGGALALNPVGLRYVTAAFDLTSRASFRAEFPEWAAMPASFLWRSAPAFTVLLLLAAIAVARRRRVGAPELIALSTTALAVYSVRFAALAAAALSPLAAEALGAAFARLSRGALRDVRGSLVAPAAVTVALAIVGGDYALSVPPPLAGLGLAWWRLPVQVSEFLRANPPPGRFWNSFNFGGYLIYALGPGQQVLIDGRNDTVYSPSQFDETMRAGRDPAVFAAQVRRYGVTTAVVECKSLACRGMPWLLRDPEWALVYWDDTALVLVHQEERTRSYVARFAYFTLRPHDALSRAAAGGQDPAAQELEHDVLRYAAEVPSSLRAQYLVALVHRAHGRAAEYLEARERFRLLAEERGVTLAPP